MLYMPTTTLTTPLVFAGVSPAPLTAARYYMLQPPSIGTTVPLLASPKYGLLNQAVEMPAKREETNKTQAHAGLASNLTCLFRTLIFSSCTTRSARHSPLFSTSFTGDMSWFR